MWQYRFLLAWLLGSHLLLLALAGSDDLYGQEPSIIGEDPWGGLQMRRHQCVDIPSNLTACQGVGYRQMRLPNLFGHDSLLEVHQQTAIWIPLIGRKCHPDTKLFLCSLFTPVCLDQVIYPCRSLCIVVKRSCEEVMIQWGYPWPEMLSCDQFPVHDVCMHPQHTAADSDSTPEEDRRRDQPKHRVNNTNERKEHNRPKNSLNVNDPSQNYRPNENMLRHSDRRVDKHKHADGQIVLDTPALVGSLKLSDIKPGHHSDG